MPDVLALAEAWGAEVVRLGSVGHANPSSGYGAWPGIAALIASLQARVGAMSAAVDTAPVRPVPAPPHPGASVAGDGPGRGQLRWLPGVALAFTVSAAAQLAHRGAPLINAVHVCILLGALAGNLGRLPAALAPGLAVAARRVLRIGIVLLGLQLSLGQPCARSGGRRARGRSCCSGCSSRSGSGC